MSERETQDEAADLAERAARAFARARRVRGTERERAILEECGGDAALEGEVRSLLAVSEGSVARRVLETRSLRDVVAGEAAALSAALPRRIGRYAVVRLIGEGGMGAVYEAEQELPRRRVALKLVRPGLVSDDMSRRLMREVELLGRLHHPGIAQVHEAGFAQPEGGGGLPQPYFAMELVVGEPITEYADRHGLGRDARLELFARLCDAVEHAHGKGVVHRDLKPQNILVDASGQPKVLDFGIARAVGGDVRATLQTLEGQVVGTLPYMSPEQVSGDPRAVDHRSDVYALGIVLFELLGHRLPLELGGVSIPDAVRRIQEEEPPRLSALDPALRGDVETIVGKALEKDPQRRYASAAELASDVRNHLEHRPIRARPPSTFYQVRTFARRHRAAVTAGAFAVLALVVAAVVASRQAVVATRARDEEQRLRRVADASAERARAEERVALRLAYRASLAAGVGALADGDAPSAGRHLDAAPHQLRGWEWEVLHAQLDDSRTTLRLSMRRPEEIAVLPDGRLGVTSHLDGWRQSLEVWDVGAGQRVHELAIDWSDDVAAPGSALVDLVASGAAMPAGRAAAVVRDEADPARAVTLNRCGDPARPARRAGRGPGPGLALLVLGDLDAERALVTCDVTSGRAVATMPLSTAEEVMAVSRDGTLVATTSLQTVRMFDARAGRELWRRSTGVDDVTVAAFAPDGRRLHCGTANGHVQVLDVATGREIARRRLAREAELSHLTLSDDGERLAVGSLPGRITLLDAALAGHPVVLAGHAGAVRALRFFDEGRRLASVAEDGTLREWVVGQGRPSRVLRGHSRYVYAVATSPDGRLLATGSWDGTVRLWSAASGAPVRTLEVPRGAAEEWVTSAAFSPDSRRILAGTRQGRLVAWTVEGERVAEATFDLGVHELALTPAGDAVVVGLTPFELPSPEGRSLMLDPATLTPMERPAPRGTAIAYDAAGARVAWSTAEAALVVADAATAGERARDATTGRAAIGLAWSPDGRRVAGVFPDGTLQVWDAEARLLVSRRAGDTRTWAIAWSPDGRRVATGGQEGLVRIWDAETFEPLADLRGHEAYVYCLAWTPDGRTLVSGSGDGTARAWSTRRAGDLAAE